MNLVSQIICDRSDWDDAFYVLHLLSSICNKTFVKINNSTTSLVQYSFAPSLRSFFKVRKFLSISRNFCKLLSFHRMNFHILRVSLSTKICPTHRICWFKLGVFIKHLLNLQYHALCNALVLRRSGKKVCLHYLEPTLFRLLFCKTVKSNCPLTARFYEIQWVLGKFVAIWINNTIFVLQFHGCNNFWRKYDPSLDILNFLKLLKFSLIKLLVFQKLFN